MSMELVTNLDNYFKGDRNICLHTEVSRTSFETGLSLKTKILDEALDRLNISFERTQPKLKKPSVVEKYKKHLNMIKPALDQLLHHIETHPESGGLKELLAVKKSLTQIQVTKNSCRHVFTLLKRA